MKSIGTPYGPVQIGTASKKYKGEPSDQIAYDVLSDGDGVPEVCKALDIGYNTYHNWAHTYPSFLDAIQRGRMVGAAWWDRKAKEGLDKKNYNERLHLREVVTRYQKEYSIDAKIDLPALIKAKTYTERADIVINALANSEITPEEGLKISQILMNGATLKEKTELEERLIEVEKSVGVSKEKI